MSMQKRNHDGQRFGRVTILHDIPCEPGKRRVLFKCDCGVVKEVSLYSITRGNTTSCGCLQIERVTKHNDANINQGRHHSYNRWAAMKSRCQTKTNLQYPDYGGRGIKVCDEWQEWLPYKEWVEATYIEGMTVDRRDNDGNYEPSNCRWVDMAVQNSNRRPIRKDAKCRGPNKPKP